MCKLSLFTISVNTFVDTWPVDVDVIVQPNSHVKDSLEQDVSPDTDPCVEDELQKTHQYVDESQPTHAADDSASIERVAESAVVENNVKSDGTKIRTVTYVVKHFRLTRTVTDSIERVTPPPARSLIGMEILSKNNLNRK